MHQKLLGYFKYHFPWQFIMLFIFSISGISSENLPEITFHIWDKLLHFIAFGILGFFLYRSFVHTAVPFIRKYGLRLSIFISIIYGISDELHQYFVPGRYCSFYDLVADILGAVVFILVYRRIRYKLQRDQNTGNLTSTGR